MTDTPAEQVQVDTTSVEVLMQTLVKGLRATQLYLPNNPVYQQAMANMKEACAAVWPVTSELVLDVSEADLSWQGGSVLSQTSRSDSLPWILYKDGIRSITLAAGAEDEELARLLAVIHKARTMPADAEDDLLTLLWEQAFQSITYNFVELALDDAPTIEVSEQPIESRAREPVSVREVVEEETAKRPEGVVNLEDFDSTLYFLDEQDIAYLRSEIEREYQQDLRGNVLGIVFDLLELQTFSTVRAELISIVENFLPYLLGVGDFRSVAYVLQEIRAVLERARELLPEHREALQNLPDRLSEPDAIAQLLQSLDEAVVHPTEGELESLFRELRPQALETVLAWLPKLTNERVRELLHQSIQRMAAQFPDELAKAMGSDDDPVVMETVRLAARLRLPPVVTSLGGLFIRHSSPEIKVAVVEALAAIGTPGAMQQLERAVEDENRDVRISAVRVLAQRGHRAVFPRIEGTVLGKAIRDADLTEKTVFFEAYGALGGAGGIKTLQPMLTGGGFLKKKEDPEIRACAAMALGRIATPEARAILESAANDKDPLVRNAVNKALREGAR